MGLLTRPWASHLHQGLCDPYEMGRKMPALCVRVGEAQRHGRENDVR